MSTWDERVAAEAERRDRKDSDWCALHAGELFRQGAEWQREQLLADEAVERAAMAILLRNYPSHTLDEARRFAGAGELDDARNDACAALTAAIGDPGVSDPSDYREDIGLCQFISPTALTVLAVGYRRAEEADTQAIEDAMRHFAEACNIASEGIRRSLQRLARRYRQDKTGGIRYGQPWQAIAKPPYRKEMF